jgi:hypothetical protein
MKVGYYSIRKPPEPEPEPEPVMEFYNYDVVTPYDYFEYDECINILIVFIGAILLMLLKQ